MAVQNYTRAIPHIPCDTREYTTAINTIFDEARSDIGSGWPKDDVQYVDHGSIILIVITYGTN